MAKVLVAEDDSQMQIALNAALSRAGHEVTTVGNGKQALAALDQGTYDIVITDQRMPELTGTELLSIVQQNHMLVPVVMITAYGTITQAVEAMQLGAADFITKPFSSEDLIRTVDRVIANGTEHTRPRDKKKATKRPIITNDAFMIRILEVCEAVARSEATVLIQGESGTGKELIARLIHTSSPRRNQTFVAVNCAALPDTLLESELFGHEKGAFTGAQGRKIGKFELAHGGTILLDEISEMDLLLQAKLLRVLQEREVDRVGGKEPVPIDVRVVATTNRNLEDMVAEGRFRADLYYRLNVIPITVPPLRQRRGDIRLLVEHFMRQNLGNDVPALSPEVLQTLENYQWPGNIRELQNSVERAAILSSGSAPRREDFMLSKNVNIDESSPIPQMLEVTSTPNSEPAAATASIRAGTTVQEMEKELILETLKATNFNRTQAAKLLGISARTLRNKLHEYREAGTEGLDAIMDNGVD